jgi:hypothetical protein
VASVNGVGWIWVVRSGSRLPRGLALGGDASAFRVVLLAGDQADVASGEDSNAPSAAARAHGVAVRGSDGARTLGFLQIAAIEIRCT